MSERIVIAIPTFKRPKSLARLLEKIAALETRAQVSVLVADNDAAGREGLALCERMKDSYRWPLRAVSVPARGIAQVRNRLVEEALRDPAAAFVAMIDDDEWPEAGWLDEFLAVQRRLDADLVQGSILFAPAGKGAVTVPDIRRATGPAAMLQGAGNLFIRRALLQDMPRPWFDPAFALTGGEDREFFVRLAGLGARFAWADDARAHGAVPESRQGLGWMLVRAYSTGNSDMRVLLKHRRGATLWLCEGGKIAAALLLSPLLAVILAGNANRRRGALEKMFRAAGKLTAMLGRRYNEYAVVHGE